jgi:hypothetical protein
MLAQPPWLDTISSTTRHEFEKGASQRREQ